MDDQKLLMELHEKIGNIDGKLDGLIDASEARDGRYNGLQTEVDKLKAKSNRQYGAAAVLAAIVAYFERHNIGNIWS